MNEPTINTPGPSADNPLSAAMADSTAPPAPSMDSDFLASTLAQLDDIGSPAGSTPTPTEPVVADPPVATDPPAVADPADPLAAIDDGYPDLDDKATPEAKAKWGELKNELKQERQARREQEQKLKDLESKSLYDPKEVDTLKRQIEELNKEMSVHRIEATQEFKSAITQPLEVIGTAAESIARRYEIEPEALFDALANTNEAQQQKALTELVEGMSDRDRLRIYQMADDTLTLLRKRDDMKARSGEAIQELELRQKETTEREAAERKRTYTSNIERVFEAFEDKLPFHPLDPNETKSAVLDALRQQAMSSDVSAVGPDVQAYSAAAGVVLPRLIKQMRAMAAENQKLQARVSNQTATTPTKARPTVAAQPPGSQSTDFLANIFAGINS
jgi:regulator of replication initiation timing